jgi:hypothetical protein
MISNNSGKIHAMKFLIVASLSNIIHNPVRLPVTYQQSKSKNQIQLLFVSSLTIAKHNR